MKFSLTFESESFHEAHIASMLQNVAQNQMATVLAQNQANLTNPYVFGLLGAYRMPDYMTDAERSKRLKQFDLDRSAYRRTSR